MSRANLLMIRWLSQCSSLSNNTVSFFSRLTIHNQMLFACSSFFPPFWCPWELYHMKLQNCFVSCSVRLCLMFLFYSNFFFRWFLLLLLESTSSGSSGNALSSVRVLLFCLMFCTVMLDVPLLF